MPKDEYKWTKTYVVNTKVDDDVQVGDPINVDDSSGGSKQEVLSVTVRTNKDGRPYKTLIVREVAA